MKNFIIVIFISAIVEMTMAGVLSGRLIVLDPGHGGVDNGAVGPTGLKEKTINLELALDLYEILKVQGADVILTRKSDKAMYLSDRIAIANEKHADLFVCIHHNSVENAPEVDRTQVYYWSATDTSKDAALDILNSLESSLGLKGNLLRNDFKVLRLAKVPAVLDEMSFISSPKREEWLRDPFNIWREALALDDGILKYFDRSSKAIKR